MRRAAFLVVPAVAAFVAAGLALHGSGRATSRAAVAPYRALHPTPGGKPVDFMVVLRMPGERRLQRFLRDVNDPASPRYRHFIDASQFGRRFGLSGRALARVERGLAARGISVTARYPQRTVLAVRAKAAVLKRVFGVRLVDYRDRNGDHFHAPATRAAVPGGLATGIEGVGGLNTRPLPHTNQTSFAEGLKPQDLAKAYDIQRLWQAGDRGQGQTVAVYSEFRFQDADLGAFNQAAGLPGSGICSATVTSGCVEHVQVNGGTNDTNAEDELDVEAIHGVAPQARILNYEVGSDFSNVKTYRDYGHAFSTSIVQGVNKVVADGRASILSISYGVADSDSLGPKALFSAEDVRAAEGAFASALAHGVNTFVATGDLGAYQCQQFDMTDHKPCVAWPAESPSVIAVGGTLLDLQQNGAYLDESGWQDTMYGWGGTGGVSERFARPSWQSGSVPGVKNRYSTGKRQVPDVSATASIESGMYVVVNGSPHSVGGTSAASPFWAGVAALMGQRAQSSHSGKLPFLAPVLYRLAAGTKTGLFHDVHRGGNRFYQATPGWDYATGLGSPDVFKLTAAVAGAVKH